MTGRILRSESMLTRDGTRLTHGLQNRAYIGPYVAIGLTGAAFKREETWVLPGQKRLGVNRFADPPRVSTLELERLANRLGKVLEFSVVAVHG